MFWMDEGLGSSIYLDGIVTVVDAKNVLRSLDEPTQEELPNVNDHAQRSGPLMSTAHLQISHADVVLLNKTDLVSSSELSNVEQRILSINALAKLVKTKHSVVDDLSGSVLDLEAYSTFPSMPSFRSKGHSHLDPTISTVTFSLPPLRTEQLAMVESWLQDILWESEPSSECEIHRTKGYIPVSDGRARVVQGVREIFEMIEVDRQNDELTSQGKIVLIGRNLQTLESRPPFAEQAP